MCRLFYDLKSIRERDPAARNVLEVFFLYSGFHALCWYRIAHLFFKIKLKFIARLFSQLGKFFTGTEIHPGATIGRGLFIDHGSSVVIGETTVIGNDCTIYQGATLGGTGKDTGKRHPTIGNNVLIGAGAKVLGPFRVGDNARIAAGAVVLSEVPDNATAVGVPARIIKYDETGKRVNELDQIHIPDPISQELCKLQHRIGELEKKLANSEKDKENDSL